MKKNKYDTIVIGSGLIGISTAYALTQAGQKVLVIDRESEVAHKEGSSTGNSRIVRSGDEHPNYPKWTAESYKKMKELEINQGDIINDYPSYNLVEKDSEAYTKILQTKNTTFEEKQSDYLKSKVGFKGVNNSTVSLCDDACATMNPESLLKTLKAAIEEKGGKFALGSAVDQWSSIGGEASVVTHDGEAYQADKLVIATNAWTPKLLKKGNAKPLVVDSIAENLYTKEVPLYFFKYPKDAQPCIIRKPFKDGGGDLYAMPETINGELHLKVGFHAGSKETYTPDEATREVTKANIENATKALTEIFGSEPEYVKSISCVYGMTKGKEEAPIPIIGKLPSTPNVYLASGFCGNGAKFALKVGELVKDSLLAPQKVVEELKDFAPSRYLSKNVALALRDNHCKNRD